MTEELNGIPLWWLPLIIVAAVALGWLHNRGGE
jgi:hypothetical protein